MGQRAERGLLGIGLTCGLKMLISGERHHTSFIISPPADSAK